MKLVESWRLSRIPYQEVVYRSLAEERGRIWWGAFGRSQRGKEMQDDFELAYRALRIAKFDKMIVAVFNVVVAVLPFASSFLGTGFGLASSISLSLAVTFGFTMLYAIQTLSSFVSGASSTLLSTLPIAQEDFSLITLFSFIRSVDYIVIGSVVSQVTVVVYITGSPLATLIMLAASTMNTLFAVTAAFWFSRVFQKNLLRGGRSKANTFSRLVFIFMWGLLLVGVGFLFSVPWYIVPNLEIILLGANHISSLLLGLLFPFSTGIVISHVVSSNVALATASLASVAMVGYALLAVLAGRWGLRTVKTISHGFGMKITRVAASDFSVKSRGPLWGYILKDLKVSSRNPATAFFFALPVLETGTIALMISNLQMLRTAMILVATSMGGIFALFLPLALLTAEGRGLEYTKTLPISSSRIIISKALVSTAAYSLVPLSLVASSLFKPLTSFSAILIPFIIALSVASASIFEIKLFLRTAAKGKISAIVSDMEKLVVGVFIVIVPEIAYAVTFFTTLNHGFCLVTMGAVTVSELAIAVSLIKRN
jgi:predicted permease